MTRVMQCRGIDLLPYCQLILIGLQNLVWFFWWFYGCFCYAIVNVHFWRTSRKTIYSWSEAKLHKERATAVGVCRTSRTAWSRACACPQSPRRRRRAGACRSASRPAWRACRPARRPARRGACRSASRPAPPASRTASRPAWPASLQLRKVEGAGTFDGVSSTWSGQGVTFWGDRDPSLTCDLPFPFPYSLTFTLRPARGQ